MQATQDGRMGTAGHGVGVDFRACLALPPDRYRHLIQDAAPGLDAQMARTLLDYKSGRQQQAMKRFLLAKKDQGFDQGVKLIHQLDRMTEAAAPLLIFELLFQLTSTDVPPAETTTLYLHALGSFHPDDAICHGAMYNSLILIALRQGQPALAERLCIQADEAYRRCGSPYLQGFVQLHLAFIRICLADPAGAAEAADRAGALFGTVAEAVSERAMVEIATLWIAAEASGELPPLPQLARLRDVLAAGEFWPETFVAFAGLMLRASAEADPAQALLAHADLEAILRLRGMTQVLPVMQLLREDHRRRLSGAEAAPPDPPALPEELVLLILPDADTVLTNWGNQPPDTGFARLAVARDLMRGRSLLTEGRFDQAAAPLLAAARLMEERGLGWLARQSQPVLDAFCREAQARRLFVEQARHIRDTLLARPDLPGLEAQRPQELTRTEFGIVQRLARLTSNKLLARELGVSEAAVKFHLKNIYRKLGVHDRRAALHGATERGWIATALPPQGTSGR